MLRPYKIDDLNFGWVYHVYLRWKTHRRQTLPAMNSIPLSTVQEIGGMFDIAILGADSNETDVLLTGRLNPRESDSAFASKFKGKISKYIREEMDSGAPEKLLSRGYFACSVGKNTRRDIEQYLTTQAEHHGIEISPDAPSSIREQDADEETLRDRLQPKHAMAVVQFHIVLSARKRTNVFDKTVAEALVDFWFKSSAEENWFLRKVSVLPEHVHLAVRAHPSVSPAEIVVRLMNSSQEMLFRDFRDEVVARKLSQIWNPGAYIGSYGDITSQSVLKYIQDWESGDE
ncbi:MAG: IS200/IS605 family transposase [Planctomycetota bacterium]|nr:IS200/IS605 family transposase [Planctomycetota bacterium]